TFFFGDDINGQRLSLTIGPVSGQPAELLKVILVVFLAGYLSENRPLLQEESTRVGPFRLPPLPYLAPMVAMWAIALGIVIVQRDLGAALLFFAVFLLLLYVSTARFSFVVLGLAAFVLGAGLLYFVFDHVRTRIDIWVDPSADPGAPHRLPVRGAGGGARAGWDPRGARPVPRAGPARAPHRVGRPGRVPGDPRRGAVAGHRRPGLHHRGRQPEAHPAHRDHAAVRELRRL